MRGKASLGVLVDWHPDCAGVQVYLDGAVPKLWCPVHRMSAVMSAYARKVFESEASARAAKGVAAKGEWE